MKAIVLLSLLCSNFLCASSDCTSANAYYSLYNPASGFVVDARQQDTVTIYPSTNSNYQLWQIQPSSRIGLFNIINRGTGLALDVERVTRPDGFYYATLSEPSDSLYQQWFVNSEGTIINGAYYNHGLNIARGSLTQGNSVILYQHFNDTVTDNEVFTIVNLSKKTSK